MFVARIHAAIDNHLFSGRAAISGVIDAAVIVGVLKLMIAAATRPHPDLGAVVFITRPGYYAYGVPRGGDTVTRVIDARTHAILQQEAVIAD
jgi:hypothetical protein